MKRIVCMAAVLLIPLLASAQNGAFEALYNKYSGREGYTTLEVSGMMLRSILKSMDNEYDNITEIKIIVLQNGDEQFEEDMQEVISSDDYQSMTTAKDGSQTVSFYGLLQGKNIAEFLMVVSDASELVVMQIKGKDLDWEQISQFRPSGGA